MLDQHKIVLFQNIYLVWLLTHDFSLCFMYVERSLNFALSMVCPVPNSMTFGSPLWKVETKNIFVNNSYIFFYKVSPIFKVCVMCQPTWPPSESVSHSLRVSSDNLSRFTLGTWQQDEDIRIWTKPTWMQKNTHLPTICFGPYQDCCGSNQTE